MRPFLSPRITFPVSYREALPYTWKQELGELDISVPVPKGTRARDLDVSIRKKQLSVGIKGKEPIMSGELCKEIKIEESTWSVGQYARSLDAYTVVYIT